MDVPRTGPQLKGFLRLWGLTQVDVAEQLDVGAPLLSNIVHGRASLTEKQVTKIERLVNRRCATMEVGPPPFGTEKRKPPSNLICLTRYEP